MCLPPESDGACKVCPTDEVAAAVEAQLQTLLEQDEPQCQLEHWELGCMRTEEHGKELGWGPDGSHYCCFQVAIWGPGCSSNSGAP